MTDTSSPIVSALLGLNVLLWVSVAVGTWLTYRSVVRVREQSQQIDREVHALFGQFQALLALERKLNLAESLPPLRGWVGSPDFLLHVANELLTSVPECVVECSSGVSTLVAARCMQLNGKGHVYSLEHDTAYANATRKLLVRYALEDWATVLDAPLETKLTLTPWYSEDSIPSGLPHIDVLIVDGPPKRSAPLARYPALPQLFSRMARTFVVLLDDADRDEEIEIVKRWRLQWPNLTEDRLRAEKGMVRLQMVRQ